MTLHTLISRLANQTVLVIGDVILDEYLIGKATRMSREAPVPVLEFESRRLIPGGAANPAANIVALGSRAMQVGVVGADEFADQLRSILTERGIDSSGIITDPTRPTTVKTRVMAHMGLRFPQQVARLDRLSREAITPETQRIISDFVLEKRSAPDAILFSDYRSGLITPELVTTIRQLTPLKILAADAQGDLDKYKGFTLVKCNAEEASTYLRRDLTTDEDFNTAALELYQRLGLIGGMVITRGGEGITLATGKTETYHCPAPSVTDVYDTVGAGDTTIAVMTLAITAGATYPEAALLANYASGLVVRRVGNYAPTPQELMQAVK